MDSYMKYLGDLIIKYLPSLSKQEQKYVIEAPHLIGESGARRMLGEVNYEFFARAYFPEYCEYPMCEFHREQYQEMAWIDKQVKGGITEVIAAPRESAKSTIWNTFYIVNNIVYRKKRNIVIISDSSTQAEEDLSKIKDALEDNEHILKDFGKLKSFTKWRGDTIVTSTDIQISAKGSGKKIRGGKHKQFRPDLIVLDDVENDENVRSDEQRLHLLNWFNKVVAKAGNINTNIIIIGTILHYDSLLQNLLSRPGYKTRKYKAVINDSDSSLWEEWEKIYTNLDDKNNIENARAFYEKNKEEMSEGVKLIWPEYKDIYYYKRALIDEGLAAYNSEFQNDPIDPYASWITPDDFSYYKDDELPDLSDCLIKGALDPSLGKNDRADPSVICTIARDRGGYMYILESDASKRRPDQIIKDVITRQKLYGYSEFYAEPTQFQELLADLLRDESAKQGVYINIVTEPRPKGGKHERIKQIQPLIKNGYIKFHKQRHKTLIDQLIYLGSLKHDDEADALQLAVALFASKSSEFRPSLLPNIVGVASNW